MSGEDLAFFAILQNSFGFCTCGMVPSMSIPISKHRARRPSDQSKVEPFKLNLRAKITVTHHDQVLSQTTEKLVHGRAGYDQAFTESSVRESLLGCKL